MSEELNTIEVEAPEVEAPEAAEPETTALSLDELRPKMKVTGVVRRLELYGAFIDIGVGVNALIHISQLGTERVNRVSDMLNVGDEVSVWVDKVDPGRNQVMVTMMEPLAVDWSELEERQVYPGKVTRMENFGAFVDIGAEREGLVHISELSHDFVKHPSEVVKVGDEVQVQVLSFSKRKRRIDLSMKTLQEKPEPQAPVVTAQPSPPPQAVIEEDEPDVMPTAMELAMRKAMGDSADFPGQRQADGGKRPRRQRSRRQQEDIINRTLQMERE